MKLLPLAATLAVSLAAASTEAAGPLRPHPPSP
jgi:hypothetical protein